jgi:TatD DNase family protein
MISSTPNPEMPLEASQQSKLRILLESDAPFMSPSNIYNDVPALRGTRLPFCHSAMIPWTAKFVADVANEALTATLGNGLQSFAWNADKVLTVSRENTKKMYGI